MGVGGIFLSKSKAQLLNPKALSLLLPVHFHLNISLFHPLVSLSLLSPYPLPRPLIRPFSFLLSYSPVPYTISLFFTSCTHYFSPTLNEFLSQSTHLSTHQLLSHLPNLSHFLTSIALFTHLNNPPISSRSPHLRPPFLPHLNGKRRKKFPRRARDGCLRYKLH